VRIAIIVSALALAANAAAQDPRAGQIRPKLQVLQDVTESQLFMVMNAVAQSLGVGCEHCHVRGTPDPATLTGGWQWDSDDKPAKATGREMMRMVRELNTSRFGGRLVVTCFTCHRGDVRVVNLPPVPPADPAPPVPALPSASDVLAKYVAALGGPGAATRFGTIVMEGRDERPEARYEKPVGRHGTFKIVYKGDRFRTDFTVPPDPAGAQVVTGPSGWASRGDAVISLPQDAIERVRRTAVRYSPMKVVEPVEALRVERIEKIGGRDAYVVTVATGTPGTRTYFFDTATGLLIREVSTIPVALLPLQEQMEYDDYRSVDGILLPFKVRFSNDAFYSTSERTFTSIRHDVDVDDGLFVKPTAAQTPTAGERYKSIRVLTDMPATSVIPTMAFISNSLGVTCLHCHTDAYESDEKPMKEKARQMIRMMRAINDTQFGGGRVVTCQTCHNGRAVPAATPPVANSGWNKRAEAIDSRPLPSVTDVLRRYESAVGVERLKTMQSQRATGTVTRNNGRTAPASDAFELFQELPRTLRLSTALSHPPEADVELPFTFLRPQLLSESYRDLRVVGRDRIPDPVLVIEGTSGRGTAHRILFNEESGLIVRRTDEIETPLGNVPEHYDFSDFKRIDGIMIPMRIVWSRADYQVTFALAEVKHQKRP